MSTILTHDGRVLVDGKDVCEPFRGCLFARPNYRTYLLGQGRGSPYTHAIEVGRTDEGIPITSSGTGLWYDLEWNLHKLADGGFVVDKRGDHITMECLIGSPDENPHAPPGTMQRYSDPWREYKPYDGSESGCTVAVDVWVDIQEKRGARVGVRKGNRVVWRDGAVTEIAACECWKHICVKCNKLRHYVDRRSNPHPTHPDDHCPACQKESE